MSDREEGLAKLREQAGGIDPAIDASLNYARGIRAVQEVTRQQGQVMSAALANNHTLYHTNKELKKQIEELQAEVNTQTRATNRLRQQLIEQQEAHEKSMMELGAAGGDRYKALYESSVRTMTAWLYAELSPDELKSRLEEMKKQARELDADPTTVTAYQLGQQGYSVPKAGEWGQHPDAEKARAEQLAKDSARGEG